MFAFNDLKILKESDRYYAIYDAGAHQVVMRKDEITKADAELASLGNDNALQVLTRLQKRLSETGIIPYVSNTDGK